MKVGDRGWYVEGMRPMTATVEKVSDGVVWVVVDDPSYGGYPMAANCDDGLTFFLSEADALFSAAEYAESAASEMRDRSYEVYHQACSMRERAWAVTNGIA